MPHHNQPASCPKIDIKSLESIKFDQYSVKIDDSETDKRIKDIAKNQPSFKEASLDTKAKEGDLVAFDYKATIDGNTNFIGAEVMSSDLRASAALILAAISAKGTSIVSRVYHCDRGYENIEKKLKKIGDKIRRVS